MLTYSVGQRRHSHQPMAFSGTSRSMRGTQLALRFLCCITATVTGWPSSVKPRSINARYPYESCVVRQAGTSSKSSSQHEEQIIVSGNVTIVDHGLHHVVVNKPPSVVCHHSDWTGSRSLRNPKTGEPEVPMLQRIKSALDKRINLVHRLDRGASGCLLCTYANDNLMENSTQILIDAMSQANKTYVAIVRGEGILHGDDLKTRGWFTVDRPIRDERGVLNNATTYFRFVAGQDNDGGTIDRPRASIVLARPSTGRWHQIRRHLNGLSHPILGDTTHGSSRDNREWKEQRGMPGERLCLHLATMSIPSTLACPNGINASCPLPDDMMEMLETHLPKVLQEARPILNEVGVLMGKQSCGQQLPFSIKM